MLLNTSFKVHGSTLVLLSCCNWNLNLLVKDDFFLAQLLPCNIPLNLRHGGVGLLYKNSLPIKVRNDLAFNESIVLELILGMKKIFFTVLYRIPDYKDGSVEFICCY